MNQPRAPLPRLARLHLLLLAAVFVATRGLAVAAGFRYIRWDNVQIMQVLDLDLLHHHLVRSLLHLHSQPPLFNAIIGLAEKLGGAQYGWLMLALQLSLSLAALLGVYVGLTFLRVRPWLCLAVVLVLMLNPSTLCFEFDGGYTGIVWALNCLVAFAAVRFFVDRSRASLTLFSVLALCLPLTRSAYHWIWLVALFAVLAWQAASCRRDILWAATAAVCVSLVWPSKNYLLFHHFTSSTWAAFSLAKHFEDDSPGSPLATALGENKVPTFTHLADSIGQKTAWQQATWSTAPTGFPELDDIRKQTGGAPNWNSLAIMRYHDDQMKDIRYLLRHDTKEYVRAVISAVGVYFASSSDFLSMPWQSGTNLEQYHHVEPFDALVNIVCCRAFIPARPPSKAFGDGQRVSLAQADFPLCFGAILAALLVAACLLSLGVPGLWSNAAERKAIVIALAVTVVYTFAVGNLVEIGENMRFRFETQGLVLMIAAIFLQQVWERYKHRTQVLEEQVRESSSAPAKETLASPSPLLCERQTPHPAPPAA